MTGVKFKEQYISYLPFLQTLNTISIITLLHIFNIISLMSSICRGDYVILGAELIRDQEVPSGPRINNRPDDLSEANIDKSPVANVQRDCHK